MLTYEQKQVVAQKAFEYVLNNPVKNSFTLPNDEIDFNEALHLELQDYITMQYCMQYFDLNPHFVKIAFFELLDQKSRITTLEIKKLLREWGFYAVQEDVSHHMRELTELNDYIKYDDNGVYREYYISVDLNNLVNTDLNDDEDDDFANDGSSMPFDQLFLTDMKFVENFEGFISRYSSNINQVRYFEDSSVLVVKFKSGTIYAYQDVEKDVYTQFKNAGSKGSFFISDIKGKNYNFIECTDVFEGDMDTDSVLEENFDVYDSSFIEHIFLYVNESEIKNFDVKLKTGENYLYYGITEGVIEGFRKAQSKGAFLNNQIKPFCSCVHVVD